MGKIEDLGVTVEEYLEAQAAGVDLLEVKGLEAWGIPTEYVMESPIQIRSATASDLSA